MLMPGERRRRFEQAVRAYSGDMYRFAAWLTRDRFLAEELVQETFARAWTHWDQLRDPQAVKAWLFTIVRREHARLRGAGRLDIVEQAPEELPLAAAGHPGAALDAEQLLDALPASLAEPLVLQVLGGYTCAEIAQLVGTTEGAVMTRLTRARQALRARLGGAPRRRESP